MSESRRPARKPNVELAILFLVYAVTAGLALWQASRHPSPTIFSDELESTQLARSIADTGHASLRGLPISGLAPLSAYLSAPFWWISDVPTAYMLIKSLGAVVMATAVFPAYGLARLAVRPRWALFAAAGTGLSPALAYAPILVKEPTAYPAATLALFLIARWVASPTFRGAFLAAAACALGLLAKDQLAVLFPILGLAGLAVVWRGPRIAASRRTWKTADWIGAALLALGASVVMGAFISQRSVSWYIATTFQQDRMIDFGLWAAGALTIGLGVVPLVAGLASVIRPKGEAPRQGVTAVATVTVASVLCFGIYAAVKAAYLSTILAFLTLERNLIYLTPVLFVGTALFLQRRGGRWYAVVAAGCFALYLVRTTPYSLAQYPNYEAHGLAILAFANRIFKWPEGDIEQALIAVTVAATAVLALLPRLRGRTVAVVASVVAAFTLTWTGTAEVYAAHGESLFSKRLFETLPQPPNWLDKSTGGRSVVLLGQGIRDPNPVYLLEFWNASLEQVWSLDGTAPGPGAVTTPNLEKPNGTLTDPGTAYVLTTPGVDIVGRRQGSTVSGYSLYPLEGPLRLRTARAGVEPDGWMGGTATYAQYDVPAGRKGELSISLSREAWCGKDVRSEISIKLGPVGISPNDQPEIREVTTEASGVLHSCELETFVLPTPPLPWLVIVNIDPTFSPGVLDPSLTDFRALGAQPGFSYTLDR